MADVIDFLKHRLVTERRRQHEADALEPLGEFLGDIAIQELLEEGFGFAEVYATLDDARHYVEQEQLRDRALRLIDRKRARLTGGAA